MRPVFVIAIVVAVWAAIYLPGLGTTELKGEEGRRILPAVQMIRTGDWVLPWSEGRPYHRKPPLLNWAIGGMFRATGVASEWTARLPSALSVLALALTGVWAGRRLAGSPGALWLPLALLSTIGLIEKGRLAEIEAIFVSLSGIGMLVWMAGWRQDGNVWARWLVAGLCFGLAGLAKGPVFLPFFYAIAAIALWKGRELRELRHPAHGCALALTFGIPGAWAAMAMRRFAEVAGAESAPEQTQVWLDQIVKRLDPSGISLSGWLGTPLQSMLLLCPWALLAALLWRSVHRDCRDEMPPRGAALVAGLGRGILAAGIAYALLPESRARFLLPLAAPVAALATMLAACRLRHRLRHAPPAASGVVLPEARLWRVWSVVCRCLFLAITMAGAALPAVLVRDAALVPSLIVTTVSILLWVVAFRLAVMPAPARIFGETALLAVWGVLLFSAAVMPWMLRHEDIRPPARQILAVTGPDPVIAAFNAGPQPFLFYLGPRCVEAVSVEQMLPGTTHILIPEARWNRPDSRGRFERRGFRNVELLVPDDDGTIYALIPREDDPPPDGR